MKRLGNLKKGSWSKRLLLIETTIVFVFLAVFLIQYSKDHNLDPIYANSYYPQFAEYLIGSFVISIASAILVELIEQEAL